MKYPGDIYLPIQNKVVQFLNKLQEANEILEQPDVVFSVIDELRNEQPFY